MEVSSVSPPSAEPTDRADLCEINVTNVAIQIVTLPIGLCGLFGNGAVLCLLRLEGRNLLIFDLAVADVIFLVFALPSALLFLLEDMSCSPIMSQVYVSFLFQLSMMSYYWGLFRLARIDVVNDMTKLFGLCWRHPPQRLMWVMAGAQYWAFFALFTVIPIVTLLCPSREQKHCRVIRLTSMFTITLLLIAAPVVISSTIDILKAKRGSQQQQHRRRGIVILLGVLFTLPISIWNFVQQLGYTVVSSKVVFLLTCINSTIKPFIYFSVGSSWRPCSVRTCWTHCTVGSLRESLQRVFQDPEKNTPSSNEVAMDTAI